MNDRKGWIPPRDDAGDALIDTLTVGLVIGVKTPAGIRRWCARHGIEPVRRGSHGTWLWRHADVQDVLDAEPDTRVSSEVQVDDLCLRLESASRLADYEEPNATCIVLTNRKDLYLLDALDSLKNVRGIANLVIVDDSGDWDWRTKLFGTTGMVAVADEPAGYTAAMQMVWRIARTIGGPVFFLEEDFTIDEPLDLMDLQRILDDDPSLAQVALQRQPWYPIEKSYGLIGAQRRRGKRFLDRGTHLEHLSCFTGNPSLIPAQTFAHDWPSGEWTEDAMTKRLVGAGMRFAYFGKDGDRRVTHHGEQRAESSHGY